MSPARIVLLIMLLSAHVFSPPLVPPTAAQTDPCAAASAIPAAECTALVDLFNATAGPTWTEQSSWLTPTIDPCEWFGVTCTNGRVIALRLPANNLRGELPASIGQLSGLTTLDLRANALIGPVPPSVCLLSAGLRSADLGFNALFTLRRDVHTCLDGIDPDWAATQLTAPRELRPAQIDADRVTLTWQPAAYQPPGAFYEISFSRAFDGPYAVHGRTADTAVTGYQLDGLSAGATYFLRVHTVAPSHAGTPSELRSPPASTPIVTRSAAPSLLIVYFPADNDLAPYIPLVTERLRLGTRLNPNVQVIFFSDGNRMNDTLVRRIADGVVTTTTAVQARWGRQELNSADPEVLAWFLRYARDTLPTAERTYVALMGHGVALTPELAFGARTNTTPQPAIAAAPASATLPPLPKGLDATPDDVTDRGYLSTVGLGRALAAATDNGANPFDLVFFDQCFQGNLDTLYEVRTTAELFIASPNYAWLAAPYHQYLPLLAPDATLETIAGGIMARYQRNLDANHPNVIFAVNRADLELVAAATNALGAALTRAVAADARAPISAATAQAGYVDTTQCGRQNMKLAPPDELIGLGGFAAALAETFGADDSYGVSAAAATVAQALEQVRTSVRVGSPHLAPEEFWDYSDNFTVLAPLPPDTPARIAWRSTIYAATAPLEATWIPDPDVPTTVTSSLAFVRDGQWDEFLAAWYAPDRPATVGEWCRYLPPALVTEADAEALTLAVSPAGLGALRLHWTPAASDSVETYSVYLDGPNELNWTLTAVLGPEQTSLVLRDLLPGATYRLRVAAQDVDGLTLAVASETRATAPAEERVYLPLMR